MKTCLNQEHKLPVDVRGSETSAHQGLTGRDVKQVSLNTNTLYLDDTILSSLILRVKLGPQCTQVIASQSHCKLAKSKRLYYLANKENSKMIRPYPAKVT